MEGNGGDMAAGRTRCGLRPDYKGSGIPDKGIQIIAVATKGDSEGF